MRLAILGGGSGAVPHMKALPVDGVELVAVAEVNERRRIEIAAEFGVETYAEVGELLAQVRPDAVLIALPHHLHVPVALAAFAAGAHVLLEKPLATTIAGCDEVIDAARRAKRTLMVGQTHHFYPNVMEARRLARSGDLGEILMATDTIYGDYFIPTRPRWFFDASLAGGGSWMANGIHLVDRTCWILDDIPESVYARMTFHPDLPDIETSVTATLAFADGKSATILMSMRAGARKEEGEILGTLGSVRYSAFGAIERSDGKSVVPVDPQVKGNGRSRQLAEFRDAISEGREPAVSGAWGREMVRILHAAYQSHRSGEPVQLRDVR